MKPDTLGTQVYEWLHKHADGDGMVETSGAALATYFALPPRTVQGAMQRLQQRGKVVAVGYRRFVVLDLAN